MEVTVIKASASSSVAAVAGAIAGAVRQNGKAEIQVIGAGALNQAMKAVIVSRGFLAPEGIEIYCIPSFAETEIGGEARTAIRLLIESR